MTECESCDDHRVPLTSGEAAAMEMHRAMHQFGREVLALTEPAVARLAGWIARFGHRKFSS